MPAASVIDVEDLEVSYPRSDQPAVAGMSFSVEQGEIFGFLGPNGAGKSTTQRVLTLLACSRATFLAAAASYWHLGGAAAISFRGGTMQRAVVGAAMALLVLGLAACGNAGATDVTPDTPTVGAGMCAPEVPDCVDVIVEDDDLAAGGGTYLDPRELLGQAEDELSADVRVSRRGDEHFMLTEDYVVGRHTVELDADTDGVYRVTAVVTEHPDGPQTTR